MNRSTLGLASIILSLTLTSIAFGDPNYSLVWTSQFGSSGDEKPWSVSIDGSGNAYITGYTTGNLSGANQGGQDAFLAKYSSTAGLLWTVQLGSAGNDIPRSVSLDNSGNAYIAGYTNGSLGATNQGEYDAFLAKYSATGDLLWKTQFGTDSYEAALGLAVDGSGNAYVTGGTYGSIDGQNQGNADAFLVKYSPTGGSLWQTQLGTTGADTAFGVSLDGSGNIYIAGHTTGNLSGTNQGAYDAYVAKYSAEGSLLWTTQFGTGSEERGYGLSVDEAGNAYITGYTQGSLGGPSQGGADVFLAKCSSVGNLLWIAQTGTASDDIANGVSVDGFGHVFITGATGGIVDGPNQGGFDAFLAEYSSAGSPLWTTTLGTLSDDESLSVAVDGQGNPCITGTTWGDLAGTSCGQGDVFIARYEPVPEPASLLLLGLGGLALLRGSQGKRHQRQSRS